MSKAEGQNSSLIGHRPDNFFLSKYLSVKSKNRGASPMVDVISFRFSDWPSCLREGRI